MKVSGGWIRTAGTQEVFARLAGFETFAVGGCVRNDLLGAPVADIDIATAATPRAVIAACAGLKVVPTGIDHGTVTVIAGGIAHEVTTFRQDVETDGRHARVVFGTDLAQDAARRDFTMNALYADASGAVVDPLGGLPDLHARRVRFIGGAEARIREDFLRILRFFRFTAWYGDALDAEGLAACAALAEGLEGLSRERVGHEMRKLLAAPDPAPAVAAMAQAGLLARVLPGADAKALPVLIHLERSHAPDWMRRLACLVASQDIPDALRLSRAEARDYGSLSAAGREAASGFARGYTLGADRARDAALIFAALTETQPDFQGIDAGAAATFPLRAADLAPRSGPQLGAALATARGHWLASGGTLDARALLKALDTPQD